MWLFKVFEAAIRERKFSALIITVISLLISTFVVGGFCYLCTHSIVCFIYAFIVAVIMLFIFSSELGVKLILFAWYGTLPETLPFSDITPVFCSIRNKAAAALPKLKDASFIFDEGSELDVIPLGAKLLIVDKTIMDCDEDIVEGAMSSGITALAFGLGYSPVVCYAANALLLSILTVWDAIILAISKVMSNGCLGGLFSVLHSIDRALIGVVYGGWLKFASKRFNFGYITVNEDVFDALNEYDEQMDKYTSAYKSLRG